jgi:general secretion pathway protein C
MNTRFPLRLASFVLFALFCACTAYWVITLTAMPRGLPPGTAAAVNTPVAVDQAQQLFGGQNVAADHTIHLVGVLDLGANQGAAAIVSIAGDPAFTVARGQLIGKDTRLDTVHARSIVIEKNGVQSEIFMPANPSGPTIYVR